MKDTIRARFEKAVRADREHEEDVRSEQQRAKTEHKIFEAGWATATIGVVVPALEEIVSKFLIPNGWEGAVTREKSQVIFEMYKGDMRSMQGGFTRPALTISPDPSDNEIVVTMVTTSSSGPIGTFTLEKLTPDLIQEYAAKFFEKLSEERGATVRR
jgi:hypothetical protein